MRALAAASLVTAPPHPAPLPATTPPRRVEDAVVAWEWETVVYAGARSGWEGDIDERFPGCTIAPGFVDAHTHLPFHGWRDDEFEARLAGRTYRDLHGSGGIARSARMFDEASDEEVLAFCRPLLAEMLEHGTTAVELKTGYGLSVDGELRQARLARRLAEEIPQTATVTLLACHAVPEGRSRQEWVETVAEELVPEAARQRLVDAVDVYVEDIAFTANDLRRVAGAAAGAGLPLRVHADQLGPTGAAEAAAALGARSADHLNHTGPEGVEALASRVTVAGLLPGSTLLLRAAPPPVGDLVAAGAALALATDFNPGTSPVLSMPEVVALGCALYGLHPGQALVAATANPAWVLGLHDRLGTLVPGSRADLVVLEGLDVRMVPYRLGHNPVVMVVCGGEPVGRGRIP
ncbi:MAG TPA: imidazolonepropionase [Actinomycetota bacterium]|nr:imidazolonepropionase [Actinomycetota bacterium]